MRDTMRAVVRDAYRPPEVLRLAEVDRPRPKDGEVRIRVHATPVSHGDLVARDFRRLSPREFAMPLPFWLLARVAFGVRRPRARILGSEFAGEIEALGRDVRRWKVGDRVFGYRGPGSGAYAEYLCMPEDGMLAPQPVTLSGEEAAALPYGALTAQSCAGRASVPGRRSSSTAPRAGSGRPRSSSRSTGALK